MVGDYGTSSVPVSSGNGGRRYAGSIGVTRPFTEVVFVDLTAGRAPSLPKVVNTRDSLVDVPPGTDDREHDVAGHNTPLRPRCWITGHGVVNYSVSYKQAGAAYPLGELLFRTGAYRCLRST